jgi:hypothetical protein
LIKKGYEVKIKDLKIIDTSGEDFTKLILEYPDYQFIVVAYELKNADRYALKRINDTGKELAKEFRVPTIFLTASSIPESYTLNRVLFLDFPFFFADAVSLKSMVRANPGILLLKNGVVINKWQHVALTRIGSLVTAYINGIPYIYTTSSVNFTAATTYNVTVGAGGAGGIGTPSSGTAGSVGSDSVISASIATALGGGYGAGNNNANGGPGGSGGGADSGNIAGTGTAGQGISNRVGLGFRKPTQNPTN